MSALIHDFRAKMEFEVRQSWQNFSEGLLIGRGVYLCSGLELARGKRIPPVRARTDMTISVADLPIPNQLPTQQSRT